MNRTAKGQIVALELVHRITYAIGSGIRSEPDGARWTLALVESATRDGVAKSVKTSPGMFAQNLKYLVGLKQVHTIQDEAVQAAAARMFAERNWDSLAWESADEIRAAIRAEVANPRTVAA